MQPFLSNVEDLTDFSCCHCTFCWQAHKHTTPPCKKRESSNILSRSNFNTFAFTRWPAAPDDRWKMAAPRCPTFPAFSLISRSVHGQVKDGVEEEHPVSKKCRKLFGSTQHNVIISSCNCRGYCFIAAIYRGIIIKADTHKYSVMQCIILIPQSCIFFFFFVFIPRGWLKHQIWISHFIFSSTKFKEVQWV